MKLLQPGFKALKNKMAAQGSGHSLTAHARRIVLVMLIAFTTFNGVAQTLFTYGRHTVSKDEFLKAYNRNNVDTSGAKISYEDYLDLYVRFRLKVQDAVDAGMDTLAAQQGELQSFRYQLAENYLRQDASVELLVDEAAERLKKDIHISIDGKPAGWITAFVLPYDIENLAYTSKPGETSSFTSSSGAHTLEVNAERPAVGEIRVAQILLALRPDATDADKTFLRRRADSLHQALKAGADFGALATSFSDDNLSFSQNGEMAVFGVGKYDTVFEKHAFNLARDGDISIPFATAFGYHILKRLERKPVTSDRDIIRQRVHNSDRMDAAHKVLVNNVRKQIAGEAPPEALNNDSATLDYYRNHLEHYSAEFADQLQEFREGNLLFAIMQQKVWDAAAADSAGLLRYYSRNREKYFWENSADALIVTFLSRDQSEAQREALQQNVNNWRTWTEASNGLILADSGRFELSQIPVVDRTNFTEGLITAPVINPQDSSKTFAYIIRLYTGKEPRSFEEARGGVITDYQAQLESQWIVSLKKKYPVRIRKKVLRSLQ